jgi:hypothetical protein
VRRPEVVRFECGEELRDRTVDAIRETLARNSVEFTNDGDQPGVRLAKRKGKKR